MPPNPQHKESLACHSAQASNYSNCLILVRHRGMIWHPRTPCVLAVKLNEGDDHTLF